MEEIWKEIESGNLKYFVSNLGRVKGFTRGLLKQRINKDGYYEVTTGMGKLRTRTRIHRLVALAFIENKDNLNEVNHKDFNRLNNKANNLEWCTHEYNMQYTHKYNPLVNFKGESNGRSLLKEKDILYIRKLYDNGKSISEIAREYGRGRQTINHIIKGNTWKHVK